MLNVTNKNFKDLSGKVFGLLTVIEPHSRKNNKILWLCKCACGNTKIAIGNKLGKDINSCGCLSRKNALKHGHTTARHGITAEYRAYINARTRCTNPKNVAYHRYGGRGIEFRFRSFKEFFAELGKKPSPEHSLDRINNNGHYEKGNVQWETQFKQTINQEQTIFLTVENKTKSLSEWAESSGIKRPTIWKRIKSNWCAKCAVTIQIGKGKCPHN